ncbi:hypothetical protein [Saccharopolyspora sp. NPDC002376]
MHPQQPGSWGTPPGGQFPQQPIQQPYPQQGFPQAQQPYPQAQPGYPQFPQQPPRKRRGRLWLVLSICAGALVLLAGGGYLLMRYLKYTDPVGTSPSNATLAAECDLVSDETLQRLHVTNPDPATSSSLPDAGSFSCSWEPTKGRDGTNERMLSVDVSDPSRNELLYPTMSEALAESKEVIERRREQVGGEVKPISGLGDEAFIVLSGRFGHAEVYMRKGAKTAEVFYSGWDKGFFGGSNMPLPEAEKAALDAAAEVAAGL